jgi:hypothetical protein
MRTLSFPTLGMLLEIADELFDQRTELGTLMMRGDLLQSENGGEIVRVLQNNLMAAHAAAEAGDPQAHRKLLRFAQLIVEKRANHPRRISQRQMADLREALLADGYELTWEPTSPLPNDHTTRCTILPTDAAPVPLGHEISALEAELASRGYSSVLERYREAVDGLVNHKYGSANGDLRATLEDLVTRLAEDHAGYLRSAKASTGAEAIRRLIQGGYVPERDGGNMLNGLWQMIHTNGPHPGQTNADEARWRMQMITATARFLLRRIPADATGSPVD